MVRWELDVHTVAEVEALMLRAKKAGYNGMLFANTYAADSIDYLQGSSTTYQSKLKEIKAYGDSIGMEFYPMTNTVMPEAQALVKKYPNDYAAVPIQNALYRVTGTTANIVADPAVSLPGGSFDSYSGNTFTGWDSQDIPGTGTFVDTSDKHSGTASMKVSGTAGSARIYKTITVTPFREYHLTYWMKTSGVTDTSNIMPTVNGVQSGQRLYFDSGYPANSGWTKYNLVFNSLNNNQVRLSFGSWGGTGGYTWVDDCSIEEIGLTNVVRRTECPVVVKDASSGTVYTEGSDYNYISDPLLSSTQMYHTSPAITIPSGSRITNGQNLRVSFYVAQFVSAAGEGANYGVASASLASSGRTAVANGNLAAIKSILNPPGLMENYDEMRVGGWDSTYSTYGQEIAAAIQQDKNAWKAQSPSAPFFVWSDMFDPYHNSHSNYYVTKGTIAGSAAGLTSDIIVVNWNYFNQVNSLKFFANNGNPQILAGYYDGSAPAASKWLSNAKSVNANVVGVMYCTWVNNYAALESFAQDAWGGSSVIDPSPTPSTTPSVTPTASPTTTPASPPAAGFTITPQTGQPPLNVAVTDTSSGATSWQYYFGDNTTNATTKSPAHTYPNPGVYTVTQTVTNSLGSSSTTKQVTVGSATAPTATPTATPTKTPTTTPTVTPTVKPSATPTITPTATATPNKPVAGFTITPATGKSPLNVAVTDTSSGATSWQYYFGDNTPKVTTKNPVHTYPNAGVYTVTQTVTNAYGSSTTTKQVTVGSAATPTATPKPSATPTVTATPKPSATVTPKAPTAGFTITPQTGQPPLNVAVTDTSSGATSWQYYFGDNTPKVNTKNPKHTYPNPGVYTVTQTVTNAYGSTTTTKQVTVKASASPTATPKAPTAGFTITPQTGTASLNVAVTDTSTGATWWKYSFGDKTANVTTKNPKHTYPNPGVYTVTQTVGNAYGSSTTTKQVTVKARASWNRFTSPIDWISNYAGWSVSK